jgi:hypothetical protein
MRAGRRGDLRVPARVEVLPVVCCPRARGWRGGGRKGGGGGDGRPVDGDGRRCVL